MNITFDNLSISWDLFVLAFSFIVLAYSLIIGRNQTFRILICTYVAIITADAINTAFANANPNLLAQLLGPIFGGKEPLWIIQFIKIFVFCSLVVLLSSKGRFQVAVDDESSDSIKYGINIVIGLLSAALLMSTILVYVSGGSFLGATGLRLDPAIGSIMQSSVLVSILIDYKSVWFALPAIAFAVSSLKSK